MDYVMLGVGLLLTIGTGLFVASEFALVNLDRADLEPAHRQQVSQFVDIDRAASADRQGDEFSQPGDQDSAWGNCSNSRRSLS